MAVVGLTTPHVFRRGFTLLLLIQQKTLRGETQAKRDWGGAVYGIHFRSLNAPSKPSAKGDRAFREASAIRRRELAKASAAPAAKAIVKSSKVGLVRAKISGVTVSKLIATAVKPLIIANNQED